MEMDLRISPTRPRPEREQPRRVGVSSRRNQAVPALRCCSPPPIEGRTGPAAASGRKRRFPMARNRRKFGNATGPILDPVTGEVLGWTYEWNNGRKSRAIKASWPPELLEEQRRSPRSRSSSPLHR